MHLIYLLLTLSFTVAEDLKLTILHNNDLHSRFEETSRNSGTCKDKKECVGGFARTAHEIRRFRTAANDSGNSVLFLNAGDTYVGTAWFAVHKWKICVKFLNLLKPDVMSLGNHEFDFGVESLAPFVEGAQFPIVAANLDFTEEPSLLKVKKSVVLDISGRKVGIVGHLTPDTRIMSQPGKVKFLDVVESVKKETEVLDAAGVKIIIILGHSGFDMDLKIAAEVPLADVVIGGHTNTFLWNGAQPDLEKPEDMYPKVVVQKGGKKVPVVQAYAYAKYLGVLNVTFDGKGDLIGFKGQPIFLDNGIPQDQDVLDLLEEFRPAVDDIDKEVVGKSAVVLDASANKCRVVECNLGNLIADSFVYYIAAQHVGPGWTDTPIGLINGGSVRTIIDPSVHGGNITRGELMGTLPFDNQIVSFKLTGSQILETLEIGARSNGETSKGEFLQFSGLHVVYNMKKPAYSRVVSVKVRCGNCSVPIYEPLDPKKAYGVVAPSFLTTGGDGHEILAIAADKSGRVQDLRDVDTVVWYLKRQTIVYPEEQGRIRFVENKGENAPSGAGRTFGVSALVLVVMKEVVMFSVK
ncbi:protein 5NUC-like [Tribolium madens]|uniref:protein 5NUC-like n=1 Tax=Tribolium madens TaxID=41895 RepID=UPI001CF72F7C|nr:protein 5NUC-like [Tribolium madens]